MTQPKQLNNAEKEQRLNVIIAEYLKRKDAGQNVSKDSMLKAYPDLADGLRSYFQNEVMIGENVPALAATKLSPISPAADVRETLKPGAALADTASEFGNRKFGRYQILRPLGEGAMGSVYLALDTTLDRQVALKVPKTEGTANAEFMARFTREAKAAAGLRHANICRVYDAGEHEGTAYITMDFIDGVPLSRFIGTEKLQSVDSILQMILTIADAVGHAHSKGVIHRDLKPGNILVDADFKPHVTDFGLARRAGGPADESRITQEGLLIGTPAYMAPEQVKGEQSKVGPQSDIYSLGVILFELLTHRLPFEGKVPEMLAKVLRDAPPVPSRIRKDLSEEVDDLCLKMLQKSPEHRFASISELTMKLEALRNKLREASVPSNQPTARQKSPFEIQKAHIELMLKKGQYAAAIQDLEKLAQETLPGAKAVADWARTKLPIVRKEAKALSPSGLEALLKTAHQMFQKSDYVGCAQLVEDIPPLRRTEAMEDLLDKSKRREAEADQLLLAIKDKEGRQDIDGLELLVKKLLKLKPGNAYAKRLSEALQSYSKTPPTRRKYRYEKGRLQPMPDPSFLRQWAVLGSLVGILVFLSVYSYVIFYLKSGNQTLAVHIDDEWLKSQGGEVTLVVDGDNHTIATPTTGGDPVTVTVSFGQHIFSVKHGDTVVHDPRQFTIEKDGRKVLSITATDVRLENGVPAPRSASELIAQESAPVKSVASINDNTSVVPKPEQQTSDNVNWIPLFDGADVSPWSTLGPFSVKDGLLVAAANTRGNAISRDEYGDFELEAEWKITKGTNSGIYYRDIATERVLPGNEYQIADGTSESDLSYNETGSIYDIIKPSVRTEQTIGEWNQTRIICRGTHVEHWLNGRMLLDYDTASPEWKKLIEASTANGKESIGTRQAGHILLQGFKGEITFRSIRIRTLDVGGENAMTEAASSSPPVAIAPFNADQAKQHQEAWAAHLGQPVEYANSIGMKLRLIPPGEFMMGSPEDEAEHDAREAPQHRVKITQPYYFGMYEITKREFGRFVDEEHFITESERDGKGVGFDKKGNYGDGPEYSWRQTGFDQTEIDPVVNITWNDAVAFCTWLSRKEGRQYQLPSEAEWEYACRAGTTSSYQSGDDPNDVKRVGNAADGSRTDSVQITDRITPADGHFLTAPVGQFQANQFGLHDMHGNVWEWCSDWFNDGYYKVSVMSDPGGPTSGTKRSWRGGSWYYGAIHSRSAHRYGSVPTARTPEMGFRITLKPPSEKVNTAAVARPMAVTAFDADQAKQHQDILAAHLGQPVEIENSIGMKLRLIPPGEFMMGSPDGETGRDHVEGPLHRVRLTQPFYMGLTEVTRSQWFAVMGTRPWLGKSPDGEEASLPATWMFWGEADDYCKMLSKKERRTYRLSTEAEWEFACRAGSQAAYSFGDDVSRLNEYAWFDETASRAGEEYAHQVAKKKSNAFGLYDMHGNVWEYCQDSSVDAAYRGRTETTIDPLVRTDSEIRSIRGGAWDSPAGSARSARRAYTWLAHPSGRNGGAGFRVVLELQSSIPLEPSKSMTKAEVSVADPNPSLKNISQVHSATGEELVAWAKNLPAGYRPYWLSVRGNHNPILYDAVASKTADQSEWIMQFYDHADETNWAEMKLQYRPALLNVYAKGNIDERLVLWVKDNHQYEYWLGSLGFMEEKLKEGLKWDQGAKSNRERWLPTSIVGHWLEGGPTYDMLMAWQPWHQCEWSLDLPLDELPALVEKYREKGWQPANLNIINGSSSARCSVVFGDNPEKRKWTFSPKLSVNEYRSMLTKVDELGGQPQCVFSRVENDEVVYSVLWHGVEL